jgi:hypothetical protein
MIYVHDASDRLADLSDIPKPLFISGLPNEVDPLSGDAAQAGFEMPDYPQRCGE